MGVWLLADAVHGFITLLFLCIYWSFTCVQGA
uniref:Uncharacterized protein n=1 Tax=Arundo donax TaxID=35708 RepID=A0A0A9A6I0_ARUDO